MKTRVFPQTLARTLLGLAALANLGLLPGCATQAQDGSDDLTSATGSEKRIDWQGYVYVAPGADDATIQKVIQRQVKSAIGALRAPEIGLQDRDALHSVDPKAWTREPLTVLDAGKPSGQVQRIRYKYSDVALVRKKTTALQQPVALLFGDYAARAATLKPSCSDDQTTDADSLWFHFTPQQASCSKAMQKELDAINAAQKGLDAAKQVSKAEVDRNFLTVRANLTAVKDPPVKYPEYDRLWGFGSDRTKLVVTAFFGVDADERNSQDVSLLEYLRFLRTLRGKYPQLAVTNTQPYASLLDFDAGGQKLVASYEDLFAWMLDDKQWPAAVGTDAAKKEALKQQVIDKFAERRIDWTLPVHVVRGKEARDMTVEIRCFWGYEDGKPEWRQAARNRYLDAFWNADVFLYEGHSHFGHGPLEPTGYTGANFPNRYQVMLINSCVSFNYYDVDFLAMHPGGSQNLDVVVNGLPAYWTLMGQASASYLLGLIDGQNRSWANVLQSMVVKPSWAPAGYDPLRAVNGELDNTFDGKQPVTVTVRK